MGNQSSTSYLTLDQMKAEVCMYYPDNYNYVYNSSELTEETGQRDLLHNATHSSASSEDLHSGASGEDSMDTFFYDYTSEDYRVTLYPYISQLLYTRVIVIICAFGLVGNILNLVILIPKGVHCSLGRIEKFAYSGLIGLAISDMLFCLMILPHGFLDVNKLLFDRITLKLLYDTYSNAVINMLMLCSTWVTVSLALGRYLAVCHPLRAREVIGLTFAKRSLVGVITCCILFNLPRFWEFVVAKIECDDGEIMYFTYYGYMKKNPAVYTAYMWVYFVLAMLVPFLLLIFCNYHLITALRHSQKTRKLMRAQSGDATGTNNNLTLVMVTIVIMYIILVSPAELINFLRHRFVNNTPAFNLAVAAVNTLQALNFSVNFVLYYIINIPFRKTFIDIVMCRWKNLCARRKRRRHSMYSSVTSSGTRDDRTIVHSRDDVRGTELIYQPSQSIRTAGGKHHDRLHSACFHGQTHYDKYHSKYPRLHNGSSK